MCVCEREREREREIYSSGVGTKGEQGKEGGREDSPHLARVPPVLWAGGHGRAALVESPLGTVGVSADSTPKVTRYW